MQDIEEVKSRAPTDDDNDDEALLAEALEEVFLGPSESTTHRHTHTQAGAGAATDEHTTATATVRILSTSAPAATLVKEAQPLVTKLKAALALEQKHSHCQLSEEEVSKYMGVSANCKI